MTNLKAIDIIKIINYIKLKNYLLPVIIKNIYKKLKIFIVDINNLDGSLNIYAILMVKAWVKIELYININQSFIFSNLRFTKL